MSDITLILLAAGESSRFSFPVKKQWLRIGDEPLWQFVTNRFMSTERFAKAIVTAHADETDYMRAHGDYVVVEGGASRQHSLRNALEHVKTPFVMVSDVARACVDAELIERLVEAKGEADCIVPVLAMHDTVVYRGETIDRSAVFRVQTPQLSRTAALREALRNETEYTDESSAIVAAGGSRLFVGGDEHARKLTTLADLPALKCLQPPKNVTLCGTGFDVHAFDTEGTLVLCGVEIEHPVGFKAHSDGDVAIHALIDALLGAAGMGDIGTLFPDTDEAYAGIDSAVLLARTCERLRRFGFVVVNVDIAVAAQTPRLAPYIAAMRRRLADILAIAPVRVSVKATTTERLGFVGRKEGVAVMASATLNYLNWTRP